MRSYVPPLSERRKVVVSLLDRGEPGRLMLAQSFVKPAQVYYQANGDQGVYDSLQHFSTIVPVERRDELLEALRMVQVFSQPANEDTLYFPHIAIQDPMSLEVFEPDWARIEAIIRTAPEAELDYDLRLTEAEVTELSTGSIPESVEQQALAIVTRIGSEAVQH